MPDVPISVWEQIQVVVVFAFLMAGLAALMVKVFEKAVEKITNYYADMVKSVTGEFSKALGESNLQWQLYFDAKSKAVELIEQEIIAELKSLSDRHDAHDMMVRNALDTMAEKRRKLAKPK